jgi:predicted nucleotidyltransferase
VADLFSGHGVWSVDHLVGAGEQYGRKRFAALSRSPCAANCDNFKRMKQANLIEVLKTYDAALRENGATAVFIFGSRARGTERPDSDLFIDYNPTAKIPNMFRLMQIEERMSEALGIPVTITTRDALHPLMKESIERDAVRVT